MKFRKATKNDISEIVEMIQSMNSEKLGKIFKRRYRLNILALLKI